MDIIAELDRLAAEIRDLKPVPFSASAMVNKEEMAERLQTIAAAAPEELKQARWIMRDRQELLERTNKEAERVISEAQVERDRLVAKTEIVGAANREADKIIEEAKRRAREIRMEAEDYVDAKLASFEAVLQKTLTAVARGRESLKVRADQEEAAPSDQAAVEPTGNVRVKRA